MVVRSLNPWAKVGGLEPQRADLWILNLEKVLAAVRANPQFSGLDLPDPDTTRYYARQVILPEVRMTEVESRTNSIPKMFPGYDEPIGGVRIDFLVDAWQATSNGKFPVQPQIQSRIYNLLNSWHQLARVGRQMRASTQDGFQLLLDENPRSYATYFKFDAIIQLYSGLIEDTTQLSTESSNSIAEGVEPTSSFNLRKSWVSSIQIGNLDHATNGLLTVSATLVPEAIVPFSGITSGPAVVVG